jgi:PAS domain S-box-containing protein
MAPASTQAEEVTERFLAALPDKGRFEQLFEHLDDVFFYVKNLEFEIVACNPALLRLFNLRSRDDIIGRSESVFVPPGLMTSIHQDDVDVLRTGNPLLGRIEVIADERGRLIWVSTNKLPLRDRKGRIVGLMGTTHPIVSRGDMPETHERLSKAVSYIENHYGEPLSVVDLARTNGLSPSQFRRCFRAVFGSPPQVFITKVRIQAACRALVTSDASIASIAADCGFCDQSYFTRQFRGLVGTSPVRYRSDWRQK